MTSTAPARRNGHSTAIDLPHAASSPSRVGQGTAIEQSRAAAEVYASVLAAKQAPRDTTRASESMAQSCGMPQLAERAFFRFNRGGGQVTGPTVHLARELARCWGNIQYGVAELRRDDDAGQSEMQAFAWDMESNARSSAVFIVPHKRDKKGGPESLTDMRDIYENNANNGARRVREAILAVLPLWFVEDAKDKCQKTLAEGGGKPLEQRKGDAIAAFGKLGVTKAQLEAHLGRRAAEWLDLDLASLTVIHKSISRGEVTVADEFPVAPVSAEEIQSQATQRKAATPPAEQDPDPSPAPAAAETTPPPAATDLDQLWEQITAMAPRDWDAARLAQDFQGFTKSAPNKADAPTMQRYLDHLRGQ